LRFEDKEENDKKSYFEIVYSTIIKIDEDIEDKKKLERIILCDVQTKIYPDLEKSLLNLLHNSGYEEINFEKKVDFEALYNNRFN
jgi:preprotein translocase subunit SecB